MKRLIIGLLLLGGFLCENTRADLLVTIGSGEGLNNPISVVAGQTAVIPVFATFNNNQEAATYHLSSLSVALDFGAAGYGYDSGVFDLQTFSVTSVAPFVSAVTPAIATIPASNWDLRFTAAFSPNVNMSTPQHLLNFSFVVPATATEGVYTINLVENPTVVPNATQGTTVLSDGSPSGFFAERTGAVGGLSAFNGSIQITAAPEPSSMALLGLATLGGVAYRRLRQRKIVKPSEDTK